MQIADDTATPTVRVKGPYNYSASGVHPDLKEIPETAPLVDASSLSDSKITARERARAIRYQRNWDTCEPRWWVYIPSGKWGYTVSQYRGMVMNVLTEEDKARIAKAVPQAQLLKQNMLDLATELKMPWGFLVHYLGPKNSRDVETTGDAGQNFSEVQKVLSQEIADRVAAPSERRKLTLDELEQFLKIARDNLNSIRAATAPGEEGTKMQIISAVPVAKK